MGKKWTEEKARATISRTNGSVGGKTIAHSSPGIKVLGAIDFLCKKHGYTWSKKE